MIDCAVLTMFCLPKRVLTGLLLSSLVFLHSSWLSADTTASMQRALVAYDKGQMSEAIALLDEALKERDLPRVNRAAMLGNRCVAKMSLYLKDNNSNHLNSALEDCNTSIELKTDDSIGYIYRAQIFRLKHDQRRALENYNVALKLDPEQLDTRLERARTLLTLDQPNKAIADYSILLENNSTNLPALIERGLSNIKANNLTDGLRDFNAAVVLQPDNNDLLMERGKLLIMLGQLDAARKDYDTLIKRLPGLHSLYNARGILSVRQERIAAALEDFLVAKRLGGGQDPSLYTNLGLIHFLNGDYTQAHQSFAESRKLAPDNTFAQLWQVVSARLAGRLEHLPADRVQNSQDWPTPLLDLFMGRTTPDEVLATANDLVKQSQQQAVVYEAFFFIGMYHLGLGQDEKALSWLEQTIRGVDEKELLGKIVRNERNRILSAAKNTKTVRIAQAKQHQNGTIFTAKAFPPQHKTADVAEVVKTPQKPQYQAKITKPAKTRVVEQKNILAKKAPAMAAATKSHHAGPRIIPGRCSLPDVNSLVNGFVVILGSYSSMEYAEKSCASVQKLGLPVYLHQVAVNNKIFFRVRAGPFNSEAKAYDARELIKNTTEITPGKLLPLSTVYK